MGSSGSFGFKVVFCLTASLFLTGCSLSPTAPPFSSPTPIGAIRGNVHGGQQPVVGAHVYLFAANTTGNAGDGIAPTSDNASVSLLDPAITHNVDSLSRGFVVTKADGSFSITGDYFCTPGQEVYLFSIGGDSGSGSNSAAGFLAILGTCTNALTFAASTPFVWMNEVSTVAAAYAFAGYATDATHVSRANNALAKTGLSNAFRNARNLADIATGAALASTPPGNGTAPQQKVNALANTLAACVNASDEDPGQCPALFSTALADGASGRQPTNTAAAAINIAHHPSHQPSTLFNLAAGLAAPFSPAPPSITDFTLAITFTGGDLPSPVNLAIDADGSVWVPNARTSTLLPGNIAKLSSTGLPLSGDSGFSLGNDGIPSAVAIDRDGNAWVTKEIANTVVELSNAGDLIPPSAGFTVSTPANLAIDVSGNAWVAAYGSNALVEVSRSGTDLTGVSHTGGGVDGNGPTAVAIDGEGNVWVTTYADTVAKFSATGDAISSPAGYTGGGLDVPFSIAIDSSGNAWIADSAFPGVGNVTKLSKTGDPASGAPYTGGGISDPLSIAIDGSGNAWTQNFNGKVIELSNSGVPMSGSTGYLDDGQGGNMSSGIAIDGSGNVWVTRSSGAVVEIIGAATPVVTPLAAAVANNTIATRP